MFRIYICIKNSVWQGKPLRNFCEFVVAMVFHSMPSRLSRIGMSFAACDEAYSNLDYIFLVLFAMSFFHTRF